MPRLETRELQKALASSRTRISSYGRVEAPVGGWNTRDSVDNLSADEAIILDNIIPDMGKVRVRNGFVEHTDSDDLTVHTPGPVESLMIYKAGGVEKMLAADGGEIYDVSTAAAPAAITGGTGFSSNRWQYVNFEAKMGMVNDHASDAPQVYNGSTISAMTISGSGLTVNNIIGIHVFKNRTWVWEKNKQDVWYSALNALGGTMTKFPLSYLGNFGGDLIAMLTWTHDGGSGIDDYCVFIMSSGEAIVYQGSSPAATGDFALVGIYQIGNPINIRGFTKFGGDIIAMTYLDFSTIGQLLQGVEANTSPSKVVGAVREVVDSYKNNWGWQAIVYPSDKLLIFNIPVTTNSVYYQFVMNLATKAWCRFKGINANTFAVYKNNLYGGFANGIVNEVLIGLNDSGSAINAEVQTAWNDFGINERKHFIAVKNYMKLSDEIALDIYTQVDFDNFASYPFPSPLAASGTAWGSPWGSPWGGSSFIKSDLQVVNNNGVSVSMKMLMSLKQQVEWYGSYWLIEGSEAL